MRRRVRLVIVGTAILVVLVILVTWFARRSVAPPAAGLGLTLLVNLRPHIEITPGTPLSIELALGSATSSARLEIGNRWRPWYELVRLETFGGEGTAPLTFSRAEPPRSMHVTHDGEGRPNVSHELSSGAVLEAGRHVHTVQFVAAPEETAQLKPGRYYVRGILETPFWFVAGWRGRLMTPSASVIVIDPARDAAKGPRLEAVRLIRAADFYLNAGRYNDAHKLATLLTEANPKEARSFILLGDALAGLNRREEALTAYHRALALVPPSDEKPSLLYERIKNVLRAR